MEVSALKQANVPGLHGPSPLLRLQSDERLIALIRRGQHSAFETLVSRYQSRLLAFCRHMLSSREDAEDVLQEVFAAAFNAILADERPINVRPWLYRIARNRSLNHLRRASAIGVDSMDVHFADHGQSTSEKVLGRESFRQLVADVQQLPETQRTALLLREIDALSYEQIAHAMETTVPSVKSLLVRARISLAEAAEARKLSCSEVRLQLGEVAEGLTKISAPVRRHVRECDRCRSFRKQLKTNNVALAAIFPVGPLLLFKKLALAKLGSTAGAGAGGAHVAGAGGAAAAGAGATAAGGASTAGGLITTIGAGAITTKAVAGLAAAALVTAGAVEADHAATTPVHHHHSAPHALVAVRPAQPLIIHSTAQPTSSTTVDSASAAHAAAPGTRKATHVEKHTPKPAADTTTSTPVTTTIPAATPSPTPPKAPGPPVTEITTETTQLPAGAATGTASTTTSSTGQPPSAPAVSTTTTTTTTPASTDPAPSSTDTTSTPAPDPTSVKPPDTTTTPVVTPPPSVASGSSSPGVSSGSTSSTSTSPAASAAGSPSSRP